MVMPTGCWQERAVYVAQCTPGWAATIEQVPSHPAEAMYDSCGRAVMQVERFAGGREETSLAIAGGAMSLSFLSDPRARPIVANPPWVEVTLVKGSPPELFHGSNYLTVHPDCSPFKEP